VSSWVAQEAPPRAAERRAKEGRKRWREALLQQAELLVASVVNTGVGAVGGRAGRRGGNAGARKAGDGSDLRFAKAVGGGGSSFTSARNVRLGGRGRRREQQQCVAGVRVRLGSVERVAS
jgi:hypothetical protein